MSDSKSKAMNWTENIFYTIEGIVPDVDDIQDTFKYVENQVSSVGGSLKKFYSGVVHDFFPLSADSIEEEDTSSTPEENSDTSVDPTVEHEANSTEPEENSSVELEAKDKEDSSDSADIVGEVEANDIESAFFNLEVDVSDTSSDSDGEAETQPEFVESCECSSSYFGSSTFVVVPGSTGISTSFDSTGPRRRRGRSLSDISSLGQNLVDLPKLVCDSPKEKMPASSFTHLSLKSNDESSVDIAADWGMEPISLLHDDEVKLDESCVFVDDTVLYAVSRRTRKLGSYKKKIQDIFTSKKRLAKEYEQLAIWYGDSNIVSTPKSQNSEAHQSCDSDWEIL